MSLASSIEAVNPVSTFKIRVKAALIDSFFRITPPGTKYVPFAGSFVLKPTSALPPGSLIMRSMETNGALRTTWTFEGIGGDGKSVTFKDRTNSPDYSFEPGFSHGSERARQQLAALTGALERAAKALESYR